MKIYLTTLVIAFLGLLFSCQEPQKENDLVDYLKTNWKLPEDYVIEKFDSHDYVFIGEYHRIKHDVELILNIIPKLHENGINCLGIEFGDYKDQHLVDSLLELPYWNRALAKKIMFECSPDWGFKEYIDIYKVAWEVNHSEVSHNKNSFRVINLGAHYDPCKEGGAWKDIDPDVFMSNVILNEIVAKNEKALIYSGSHHAFTRYHQPRYSFEKDTLYGFTTKRMGNVIFDSLKNRTFNIYLHAPWVSDKGWDKPTVLPVNGVIDTTMDIFENKPIGFDVVNSPFGKLFCNDSYYAFGYPNFTLDKFCDGYIYQKEFKNYRPITMEDNFITNDNIDELKVWLLCRKPNNQEWKEHVEKISIENANDFLFEDITNHFDHLMK